MIRSLRRTLLWTLLACALGGGFVWGRSLRSTLGPRHTTIAFRELSRVLSANAGGDAVGDVELADQDASDATPSEVFEAVLDYVQREYVAGSDSNLKLSNGAVARMVASLNDPHTLYLEPELSKARQNALQGRYYGIGAVLTTVVTQKEDVEYRYLTVVDVMPGSPAEKAGLRSGDHITEVNGHWVINYSPRVDWDRLDKQKLDDDALQDAYDKVNKKFQKGYTQAKALPLLLTGENTSLTLTVDRAGQPEPLKVSLTTALTKVDPVEYEVIGNRYGYLRVRQFNPAATGAFQEALRKLDKNVKGLIVDLRQNPGGVRAENDGLDGYNSALKLIAGVTHGGVVGKIERKPNQRDPLVIKPGSPGVSLPMVVLVDRGTANLSELVASALREVGKAKVIGEQTFGDSSLELFALLKNGSGLEIANARLLTGNGADLAKGVTPDIVVTANPTGSDAALERAVATLGAGA